VLVGTPTGKREVERFYGVGADRIRVIPFPVPATAPDEPEGDALRAIGGKQFIFYPAQFWPHKNHVNLLRAMRLLVDDGRDLSLVLTGSDKGNKSFVAAEIAALGLADRVIDLGFVSRGTLEALYRGAQALVFPTFFGPDNLPPLEAFALGCPVLASDIAGAGDQLGEAALRFNPARPNDIAACIATVCDDAEVRGQLLREGAKIAAERSPARYVTQVQALLDEFRAYRRCWGAAYRESW
jgi:glycosyltransferase involved in cell wall biosynthesis